MNLRESIKRGSVFSGIMIIFHFVMFFIESSFIFVNSFLENFIHFVNSPATLTVFIFNTLCPRENISGLVIPSCGEYYTLFLSISLVITIVLLFLIYLGLALAFLYTYNNYNLKKSLKNKTSKKYSKKHYNKDNFKKNN